MKALRRRVRWRRAILAAAIAGVIALVVVGLSLPVSHQSANDKRLGLIRRAPHVAMQSHRFQMTLTISLVPKQGPTHYTTETAGLDAAHGRATLLLSDVMSPVAGGWRMVSQGKMLYLLLASNGQGQFPGKSWVAVELASPEAAQGAAVGPIPDPLSFLAGLRGVEGTVRRAGSATIDGTSTTAYEAVINVNAMRRAVGTAGSSQVQALRRLGGSDLPVTVWLDGRGRPRQIDVRAELGEQGSIFAEVKFTSFGAPLRIGIPPANVVVTAPTLAAALSMAGIPTR